MRRLFTNNQPKMAKVLAALLVSMTAGAMLMMALGDTPPSAGLFSLWAYYNYNPKIELVAAPIEKIDVNDLTLSVKRVIIKNNGNVDLREIRVSFRTPEGVFSVKPNAAQNIRVSIISLTSSNYYLIDCPLLRSNEQFEITTLVKGSLPEEKPIVVEVVGIYGKDDSVGTSLTTSIK